MITVRMAPTWMIAVNAVTQSEGAEDFFVYESAVNKIVEDKPAVFMCMYDLDRFGVSMLVDVLTTHPKVLLGGMVLYNPQYLTPREYLAAETASAATRYPLAKVRRPRTRVIATQTREYPTTGQTAATSSRELDADQRTMFRRLG